MNSLQENKVSMYFKIRTFFVSYLTTIAAKISAITALVTNFNNKLDDLTNYDIIATTNITGYSEQKNALRKTMTDLAMVVAGGVRAYFLSISDLAEAKKAQFNRSLLDAQRDSDILVTCIGLYKFALANATAIIPFGVSTLKLTAYDTSVNEYEDFIQHPADQRSKAAFAGQDVDSCIEDIDEMLLSMDAMMETIALEEPSILGQYKLDRLIDDNTGGGTSIPPDYSFTLVPNSFFNVCTLSYLSSRAFKARNNSDSNVNWSLSTGINSFSTAPQTLDANSVSTKMSSTLASEGDFLLFENPNPVEALIEVWILE